MKSELLISAAMIPMWGMAGEAIAASPEKGVPKEKATSEHCFVSG